MATARAVHKIAGDGQKTVCGVRVSSTMKTKPTYRGVTCVRCKAKKGGKK